MILAPTFGLGIEPTPLVRARRLNEAVGVDVWLKRDDLIGFAQAGTKARPLEFLVGDALAGGYDCLVGCGGASSNFIAALAAAAAIVGLGCHLVLYGQPARAVHPNLAAARCWARWWSSRATPTARRSRRRRRDEGRRSPPRGFAPTSCPAVARPRSAPAAAPWRPPSWTDRSVGGRRTRIVVAAGSGTTAAGLLVGLAECGWPTVVLAAAVSRPNAETRAVITRLAAACARLRGVAPPAAASLEVVDAIGPGFGLASPVAHEAAQLALRTEGVVLDPTYTAKAFAVLLDRCGRGLQHDGTTVFWHTGGIAGAMAALASSDPSAAP